MDKQLDIKIKRLRTVIHFSIITGLPTKYTFIHIPEVDSMDEKDKIIPIAIVVRGIFHFRIQIYPKKLRKLSHVV